MGRFRDSSSESLPIDIAERIYSFQFIQPFHRQNFSNLSYLHIPHQTQQRTYCQFIIPFQKHTDGSVYVQKQDLKIDSGINFAESSGGEGGHT